MFSQNAQIKDLESAQRELHLVKEDLADTPSVVERMKNQLLDCKKLEAQAHELVSETLMQLETAKKTVETLRSGGCKATETYDAIAFELEQSRARVKFLEELVCKLKADIDSAGCKEFEEKAGESTETDFTSVKLEVEQLRSALEVAEIRSNEEQARSAEQLKNAFETVEWIKSASGQREAELEAELRKSRYEIEELKANLKDKETELQSILEENDDLILRLESTLSGRRERKLEKELRRSWGEIQILKARFMDRETEWRNASDENEKLKLEIKQISERLVSDLEVARAAEREALMKVGFMAEEVDKSNKKTARVSEQLEAAQAANAEMEAELRRLKVQSDQCRKAAEAAASMLLAGSNGQLVERTGSMDRIYGPWTRRVSSAYVDELDDDLLKKKNANMLSRFGVLWKKQQK
ncbi:interactor of constitutive active ROPs 3-like [Sesamum indicum]|uniref:Interactor of constitutive active ROPs 3-like n=1 Tax=Sesamum indicum TaxID=4182 RepID=A0A6I9TVH3_SESIN|nr:interactor of constitutive active ROPs 3-like [Sesamum indicum]XP_020552298.1 interactor of constitutive active ROPs 3-like [Sesamum indicum]